jgi:hypothetical protein
MEQFSSRSRKIAAGTPHPADPGTGVYDVEQVKQEEGDN